MEERDESSSVALNKFEKRQETSLTPLKRAQNPILFENKSYGVTLHPFCKHFCRTKFSVVENTVKIKSLTSLSVLDLFYSSDRMAPIACEFFCQCDFFNFT